MTPLQCPSCGAVMSLDVCLAHEELRQAYADTLKLTMPLPGQMFKYVSLFRPKKNKMSPERFAKIANEVIADIQAESIQHNGRNWAVPMEIWRAGFEALQARVEGGKLEPPLTNHNYLYKILAGLADKVEGAIEREREQDRRNPTSARRVAAKGFTDVADVLQANPRYPPDPELTKIKNTQADPMPDNVKKQLEEMKKGKNHE